MLPPLPPSPLTQTLTSIQVHIGTPVEKCRQLNQQALDAGTGGYASELFENLVFRYEEPNGMTRWDSPLYTVPYDDSTPPLEELWDTLVGGKAKAVKPNSATVLAPATEQNYLYELDNLELAERSSRRKWWRSFCRWRGKRD
jgi:protein KTI12